jgi:hypothetical protein
MMTGWQSIESHAAARKLAQVRELIRRRTLTYRNGTAAPASLPGDLPAQWDIAVAHEVAASLGMSWQAADPLVILAWEMEARLPATGRLLDDGILTYPKAALIAREFSVLDDEKAAEAEKLLLEKILDDDGRLRDGMTPGEIGRRCQHLVDTVDPDGARKRRENAEREQARVRFYRDHGGAAAMFAGGLPTDEALVAQANIQKRALEYRNAGLDEKMDLLRVLALLDSVNGVTLAERIARYHELSTDGANDTGGNGGRPERGDPDDQDPGTGDDPGPGDGGGPGGDGPHDGGGSGDGLGGTTAGKRPGEFLAGATFPGLPTLANMTYPLATVLGEASRPGSAASYGSLDPDLTRKLADAAARSDRSQFCVTFTDSDGHAAGHGCGKPIRDTGTNSKNGKTGGNRDGPGGTGWAFSRDHTRPGPPGGYGIWTLTVPGGRRYRVEMHKVPLDDCDHKYATDAYRPSDLLRHLVQIRDGRCTSPACSQPATQCDFEHAVPWDQGGPTDACNAGARSRRCHQVKQRPGWKVTQPRPAWHRWETPSGRAYTKGPMQYPS